MNANRNSTKTPARLIAVLGLALLIAVAALMSRRHDPLFGIDGETYYIAARVFLAGSNPYNGADMLRIGQIVDPATVAADHGVQPMTNLPASLLPFLPLSLLPPRAFDWTLIALAAFCLPVTIVLSARLLQLELSSRALIVLSILSTCFPPVWRSLIVGQPLVPILACLLALCRRAAAPAFDPKPALTLSLLSLVKATCSLPLAAWLMLSGHKPLRAAVFAALAAFALLNLLLIAHIGLHSVLDGYRAGNAIFGAGGANDPYTGGQAARIDLQPLAALFTAPAHLAAVSAILDLLLAAPLLALLILRPSARPGETLIAVLLLTLIITYHRPYDAVLALPLFPLILQNWRSSDHSIALIRAAALLLVAATLGDHNIQHVLLRRDPTLPIAWIRPAGIIALYLSVALPSLRMLNPAVATHPASSAEAIKGTFA